MSSKKRINFGKIFEYSFKKSVPDYALYYRLPDPSQSFGGGNLRFSSKCPFDCMIFDSKTKILYALELKSVAGKSISFERTKEEKGEIHFHQIEGLNKWDKYDGTICGFIIEFRELEKTIFINIQEMNMLMKVIQKKSFNFTDLDKYKIQYFIIPQKKLKVNYKYDIHYMLTHFVELAFNIERKEEVNVQD